MKSIIKEQLFLQVFFLFCVSCTYNIDELPTPNNSIPIVPVDSCNNATITYTNYIKGILDSKCNSIYCHGGGAPGNFTAFTGTKASVNNGSFKKRVIDGVPSFMPPGSPLPQQQLDSILIWINQGACE
jgi:hypothetical protein